MLKSLFDPEGAFAQAMDRVGTLVLLNVLWLVCALPVVTAGPATAALYVVLRRVFSGDEGRCARQFFAAFRENFRPALGVWIVVLCAAALCLGDLYAARVLGSRVLQVLAVLGLQIVALEVTLVFPLLGRFDNTVGNHLRNALVLAVGHLPRTLLIWLIWAIPVGVTVFVPGMLVYLSIVWLLIGFSSLSAVTALLLRPVFTALEETDE